ncbi:SCO family protein [Acuticoccus sediminis]|uniref:SCO family protein n=1 Tax=Acuticoccus sediminis TaxID=2184697 RepID=A0A8B2NHA5_9HYPH|nr:SCO family protein [Acuticoccus sediminis]RAH96202.1 SCO family protein [Acuticoccus sediminis]
MSLKDTTYYLRRVRLAMWACVAAVLLVAGVTLILRPHWLTPAPEATFTGEADIRSQFSLVDHTGRAVTEADFAGRWQLVFFGFTHCPDICPTTLAYMASVLDLLGPEAERVAPLFITVDPARDTVPVMAEYVSAFHPRLVGLTGTEAQVAEAAKSFRTWYERVEDETAPDGYMMAHAGHIFLMRQDGGFDALFQERDQLPEDLAKHILTRIREQDEQ